MSTESEIGATLKEASRILDEALIRCGAFGAEIRPAKRTEHGASLMGAGKRLKAAAVKLESLGRRALSGSAITHGIASSKAVATRTKRRAFGEFKQ